MTRRPLGKVQALFLQSLREHGGWHVWCGWVWSTDSRTTELAEALVRRGYAVKTTVAEGYWAGRVRYIPTSGPVPREDLPDWSEAHKHPHATRR